jgi:hypothetical protein
VEHERALSTTFRRLRINASMSTGNHETQPLPPRWGKDELSKFLHDAFKHNLATFVHKPAEFSHLARIDAVFTKVKAAIDNSPNFLEPLFLFRSHSAFLASVRSATSGQIPETYPLLRSCLEYALYAHHIACDEKRGFAWVSRHENADAMKACRKEFMHSKVIGSLAEHQPHLHKFIEALYERTIDYGAHPNERGLSTSTKIVDVEGEEIVRVAQLQGAAPAMHMAMQATADVGTGALSVFSKIFEARFRSHAIDAELELLRGGR